MTLPRFDPFTAVCCAAVAGGLFLLTGMRSAPGGPTPEQLEILQFMSLVKLPDGVGGYRRTVRFTDVNVQLVNGNGSTATTDGTGNLIVGYDEDNGMDAVRTGSHNLVVGIEHGYSDYGGVVFGAGNTVRGSYATISGGTNSDAGGFASHVCGGNGNLAQGTYACVNGGTSNSAVGDATTVVGGTSNEATGLQASVLAGRGNLASGTGAVVCGGDDNECQGSWSTVSGTCNALLTTDCSVLP